MLNMFSTRWINKVWFFFREKVLADVVFKVGMCFAENGMYCPNSFFSEPRLANFLINILKPLEEIHLTLDSEITMGIQYPSFI